MQSHSRERAWCVHISVQTDGREADKMTRLLTLWSKMIRTVSFHIKWNLLGVPGESGLPYQEIAFSPECFDNHEENLKFSRMSNLPAPVLMALLLETSPIPPKKA